MEENIGSVDGNRGGAAGEARRKPRPFGKVLFELRCEEEEAEDKFIRIPFALLHSEAFRSLTYAPALKVLCWFHEKGEVVKVLQHGRKKGYAMRYRDVSFTFAEAGFRGLDHKKFARALRELHERGFIDLSHRGSWGRDASRYNLTHRWLDYGTIHFKHIPFPENTRDIERDEGGRRKRKNPTA